MKKIDLTLLAMLVAQLVVVVVLLARARSAEEQTIIETKVIASPATDEAKTRDLAQVQTIVEKLHSGELDPFAGPKNYQRPNTSRPAVPRKLSIYDRMVATPEGGALVRAEISAKIEQTYQHELAALRLTPDELRNVTAILTDLEMAKVDIRTMSTSVIPYAEQDRLYRAAVADDLKLLEETLGPERYKLACETYANSQARNSSQTFVDECTALGIPLNDAAKVGLVAAWQKATTTPAGMVIGSPLRSDRNLTKTDWDKLTSSAASLLNSEQQNRLLRRREQGSRP